MLILKKMPRTQLSNIRKFFIYKISTDSSVCQIDDCGTALRGNHASNLQRHVKRFHQECFKKYKEKYFINLSIKSKKIHKNVMNLCLKMLYLVVKQLWIKNSLKQFE